MNTMEPTTTSQTPSEPLANPSGTDKAYGNRNFEPDTVPGLIGDDPLIPASVTKFFRKLFRRSGD
jgi:hypothetical protein